MAIVCGLSLSFTTHSGTFTAVFRFLLQFRGCSFFVELLKITEEQKSLSQAVCMLTIVFSRSVLDVVRSSVLGKGVCKRSTVMVVSGSNATSNKTRKGYGKMEDEVEAGRSRT